MFLFLKYRLKYSIHFVLGVALLTAGCAVYPVWFQRSFHFPKPTGSYPVGIKTYHWVDDSRKETLGNDPLHPHRELMVNIWYPAQGQLSKKPTRPYAPYLVDGFKKNDAIAYHLIFSRGIYSYAQSDIQIANDETKFPIILFSHGLGAARDANTAHCEELASHGYIVVGISHTYDSCIVQFSDGRLIEGNEDKRFNVEQEWDLATKRWIADVQFVLHQFEQLNNNEQSVFYQKGDQERIGMFGHSFGGSTAIQMCRLDSRIKAGADLDGSLFGPDATKKFDTPCMFLLSGTTVKSELKKENPAPKHLPAFEQLEKSNGHDVYTFVLENAGHTAFCDNAFAKHTSFVLRILMKLGIVGDLGVGSIDGFRATEIVNAYLVGFFDKCLKGRLSPLLDGKDELYPEMKKKWWNNG